MDQLIAMRVFVRAAELGSFSAVADQMGVARSVITRQIALLESHLGVKLMIRSTRHLALTSEGAAYLEQSRHILGLVEAAEASMQQERHSPRGHIRISVPLVYGLKRLAPLLLDFATRFPEVELDMDYTDRRVHLIEEGVDLSVRITPKLDSTDVARKLGVSHMRAIASPGYLAQRGRPQHPRELAQHDCLGYAMTGYQQNWTFIIDDVATHFPIRSRINANNGEVLTQAAVDGLGITCQPDFIIESDLNQHRVEPILDRYPIPELGIYAMLPSSRLIPHRVRVLIDFLAHELASTGASLR